MKQTIINLTKWVTVVLFALFMSVIWRVDSVLADGYSLTMAPMNQSIIIDPGDSYETSFRISNAAGSTQNTYYKIEIEPFFVNDKNEVVHEAEGESGEIVKWTKINIPTEGSLAPNETKDVSFTISVPKNAPSGGQYMSVMVTAGNKPIDSEDEKDGSNTTVKEVKKMSHLVYAEITGSTIKTGEFLESNLPSFILSGNIAGSATVKNTGNVHQKANYTLQVYPLFSGEEVYTNEENPASFNVMPGREVFSEVSWKETPEIGIFNVVFKGDFGGQHLEVSKMVIKCPLWLLFILLFAIFAIVIFFVVRFKKRNSGKAEA